MGDIVKLALRLFIFALVASVLLAVTNEVTKGPIEQQKLASKMAALNTVLPGCEYEQIEYEGISDDSALDEIFIGKNADGSIKGYALTANPQGYGGEIPITLGVSEGGYVTQVYVGSLQETQGLGSRVGDDAFKEQFIAIAADPDTLRNDVDTIAGATISSSAFVNAVQEMLTYTKGTLGIEPHAGDKDAILAEAAAINGGDEGEDAPVETTTNTYDVTGFAAFKVDVTVDSNGKIVSVSVPENNETPGFGADLIADQSVFDALVGQDIATAQIDVKSGATLTSNAINDALKQAAADLGGAEAAPAVAGDPYTVKGMNKFTLYVEVKDGGKIASVSAPNNSETPGFGADMLTDEALSALVGEDLATAHVDVKSGVTLTSDAINAALKQAAIANGVAVAAEPTVEATAEPTAEPAAVPTVAENAAVELTMYDVTGFAPFKVGIAVDENGKIVSVSVPENSETPGLGADLIADQSIFDALVGQDIATAQIDVKSGVTLTSNAINDALKQAASAGESGEGSAKAYDVTGFAPFKVEIALDDAGKIVSVSVPENNETPGFGADLIADQSVFDALVGQDIATAQIDVKSGATLTSNAINDALKQAAADLGGAEAAPAVAGDPYTVKGMNKFTLYVEVKDGGKIASVSAPNNSETPGFGADMLTDEALSALVGEDLATAHVDVKSGVTLTSDAINAALKQAAIANGVAVAAEPTVEATAEPTAEPAAVPTVAENAAVELTMYDVTGFAPFKVGIAVDENGKIVSVSVPENSETPGLGADLIADQSIFDALVGQDIATAQIDVKSGVTLTSNAINDALRQAAAQFGGEATRDESAADGVAIGTYDVTGFAPFKVEIAVDGNGKIVSVSVPENNETPGFGADLIADQSVFDALVGQDIATAKIDVKSGVTLTSNAINDALGQAAKEVQ